MNGLFLTFLLDPTEPNSWLKFSIQFWFKRFTSKLTWVSTIKCHLLSRWVENTFEWTESENIYLFLSVFYVCPLNCRKPLEYLCILLHPLSWSMDNHNLPYWPKSVWLKPSNSMVEYITFFFQFNLLLVKTIFMIFLIWKGTVLSCHRPTNFVLLQTPQKYYEFRVVFANIALPHVELALFVVGIWPSSSVVFLRRANCSCHWTIFHVTAKWWRMINNSLCFCVTQ